MSRDGATRQMLGGKMRDFRFGWAEWEGLQDACDASPMMVLAQLQSGMPKIQLVSESLRWGLIGGGATRLEAEELVDAHVKNAPLAETIVLAGLVVSCGLYWPEDDLPGKPEDDAALEAGTAMAH
ncbi:MAG: GTA-gp10 family protein [Pseudomonadota bacterium]